MRAVAPVFGICLLVAACAEPPAFSPRTKVGSLPDGFTIRPVSAAADAASYIGGYMGSLGLGGVRVAQVLSVPGTYWVYVTEEDTGRPAFALAVRADGAIEAKNFPGMAPEMMWNQKYGHRARLDLSTLAENVSTEKADGIVRNTLASERGLRPGDGSRYYGYVLYPLCEERRFVGEAAVNTADGAVVWKRFPQSPRSWTASGADDDPCG